MPPRRRTFKNIRQRESSAKRVLYIEEEDVLNSEILPKTNPYVESFDNLAKWTFESYVPYILDVPDHTVKFLKKHCLPKRSKFLKAHVYGRDGVSKGLIPSKRDCDRYTYRQTDHPFKCRIVMQIVKDIVMNLYKNLCISTYKIVHSLTRCNISKQGILDVLSFYQIKSDDVKVESSHFDVLHYEKTCTRNGLFDPHRDALLNTCRTDTILYSQMSILIPIDSHITSQHSGATEIYNMGARHIFPQSTQPGQGLMFPAVALHGSQKLVNIGDYKIVLKFDVYTSINLPTKHQRKCNCCNCDNESTYNKSLRIHEVFHGWHKKLPVVIIQRIGLFRGEFLKCSCPFEKKMKRTRNLYCICECTSCVNMNAQIGCNYSDIDYDYDENYICEYDEYCNGYCNGD